VRISTTYATSGNKPWAVTYRHGNFVAHCRFAHREDAEAFRELVLDGEHPDRAERMVLERRPGYEGFPTNPRRPMRHA
jgi:hypothetical protein